MMNKKNTKSISSRAALMSDLWRWHGRTGGWLLFSTFVQDRAFRPILTYRMCKWAESNRVTALFLMPPLRLLHRIAQGAIGFELPLDVDVGPGLRVYHGWSLVINDKVKIGENVTLLHSVTIGGTRKGAPTIEDDVTVATGAIIIGPVTIGKGSIIGAGAVVTKDVPKNSVVVGNPQRILRRNDSPLISNKAPVRH